MVCTVIRKKDGSICYRKTELLVNGFAICSDCYIKMAENKIVFVEVPVNTGSDSISRSIVVREK